MRDRVIAWLAGTPGCAMLVGLTSSLIFARTSGIPAGPSCQLEPRLRPGFLLGAVTTVALLTLLN